MKYYRDYFDRYHRVDAYRSKYPDENVIRFLISNFPKEKRSGSKILDLGCGCGRHLILLKELGFDAYGMDGSPVALKYAADLAEKRGLTVQLDEALITDLPYENEFFDGIIEHATLVNNSWEDILKACNECYRVLKDKGLAFFLLKRKEDCAFDNSKEISKNTFLSNEEVFISRSIRDKAEPLIFHAFTKDEIIEMLHKFSKIKIHTWDMSFKDLKIKSNPGDRLTAYWIVIAQK